MQEDCVLLVTQDIFLNLPVPLVVVLLVPALNQTVLLVLEHSLLEHVLLVEQGIL